MSKILIKLPRFVVDKDTGAVIRVGKFEKHLVRDTTKVYSDSSNTIPAEELSKEAHSFSAGKDTYITLEADFLDKYKQMKRQAQIITLKDIGRIITLLGLTRDSVVVEAGSGSGAATRYFSELCKEVHSYEIYDEHLAVAKENCKDCKNVHFYSQDIYEDCAEHKADGFLLDVPDPKKALQSVYKALRMGGRVVVYTPNLTQAQSVIVSLGSEWLYEETLQMTENNWKITDMILRPKMQGLGHTAFLTVLRKMPLMEQA